MFNKVHALLLAGARIWQPPIHRRRTGGITAGLPTAKRRDARRNYRRIADVITVVYPSECPAKLPGKLRANAGKLSDGFRAFARQMVGKLSPQCRRPAADNTGAVAVQSPVILPPYARL
jgi:hypothetical protein